MANSKNLVKISDRSTAEARKISKIGGIRSGEARREKKSMRDTLNFILDSDRLPTGNKAIAGIKNAMLEFGYAEDEINIKTVFAFSLLLNAITGKAPKYAEMVLDIIGEKPTDKIEITGSGGFEGLPTPVIITNFTKPNAREEAEERGAVVCLPDNGRD